jgi:hypothetical protein
MNSGFRNWIWTLSMKHVFTQPGSPMNTCLGTNKQTTFFRHKGTRCSTFFRMFFVVFLALSSCVVGTVRPCSFSGHGFESKKHSILFRMFLLLFLPGQIATWDRSPMLLLRPRILKAKNILYCLESFVVDFDHCKICSFRSLQDLLPSILARFAPFDPCKICSFRSLQDLLLSILASFAPFDPCKC